MADAPKLHSLRREFDAISFALRVDPSDPVHAAIWNAHIGGETLPMSIDVPGGGTLHGKYLVVKAIRQGEFLWVTVRAIRERAECTA